MSNFSQISVKFYEHFSIGLSLCREQRNTALNVAIWEMICAQGTPSAEPEIPRKTRGADVRNTTCSQRLGSENK